MVRHYQRHIQSSSSSSSSSPTRRYYTSLPNDYYFPAKQWWCRLAYVVAVVVLLGTTTTTTTTTTVCHGFSVSMLSSSSSSSSKSSLPLTSSPKTTFLSKISQSQLTIIDGGEWSSIQSYWGTIAKNTNTNSNKFGYMTLVAGETDQKERVIAIQKHHDGDGETNTNTNTNNHNNPLLEVYQDSMAIINHSKLSNGDALATYASALGCIYTALPKSEHVGGSNDTAMIGGTVVVLGSSSLACFAATGLASLGLQQVYLVTTTSSPSSISKSIPNLQVLKPAVGSNQTAFCTHIGTFDCLVDTLWDERNGASTTTTASGSSSLLLDTNDDNEDDNNDNNEDDDNDNNNNNNKEDDGPFVSLSSTTTTTTSSTRWNQKQRQGQNSIVSLLQSQHDCQKYISTHTHCQSIIIKEGIFGGPKKAEEYVQSILAMTKSSQSNNNKNKNKNKTKMGGQPILPPPDLGGMIQHLYDKNIILGQSQKQQLHTKKDQQSMIVRGWNWGDFWEQTTWPRDSSGNTIRFGFPTITFDGDGDDNDDDEEYSFRKPLAKKKYVLSTEDDEYARDNNNSLVFDIPPQPKQENPHVLEIAGVYGMQTNIIQPQVTGILFLSAKFCKTCKAITPVYTRMARLEQEQEQEPTTSSSSSSNNNNNKSTKKVVFCKAEASGKWGKALGKALEVDAVPAFLLFRNGQLFGTPLSVSKLPSKKIDRALDLLRSNQEWDPNILKEEG